MDLNPKDYRAWYGLGQTYELLHMPVYALHYYQRATQVILCTINQWALQVALLHVLALRQQQRIANDDDAFRAWPLPQRLMISPSPEPARWHEPLAPS